MLSAIFVIVFVAVASADKKCTPSSCTPITPPECPCNYIPAIVTPRGKCCPQYKCVPPPPEDAFTCPANNLQCGCGLFSDTKLVADPLRGVCCPTYDCFKNKSTHPCECVQTTCPPPPKCYCNGFSAVVVDEPRAGSCCPTYKCKRTNRGAWFAQLANCRTLSEFYTSSGARNATAGQGCNSTCGLKAVMVKKAKPLQALCCPEFRCITDKRAKCCSQKQIDSCKGPTMSTPCQCPNMRRVLTEAVNLDKGKCCPKYECIVDKYLPPANCDVFKPACNKPCQIAIQVRPPRYDRGRCCGKWKCKRDRACNK